MEFWKDHTGVDVRGVHRCRGKRHDSPGSQEIDLTPMLDVVMIMLIFFIVTGSFVKEIVLDVERKQTSNVQSSGDPDNITVLISANDEFWIGGRRVEESAVRANITRLHAEKPKASVIIKADNKSTLDAVATVMDSSREAGIYSVALSSGE